MYSRSHPLEFASNDTIGLFTCRPKHSTPAKQSPLHESFQRNDKTPATALLFYRNTTAPPVFSSRYRATLGLSASASLCCSSRATNCVSASPPAPSTYYYPSSSENQCCNTCCSTRRAACTRGGQVQTGTCSDSVAPPGVASCQTCRDRCRRAAVVGSTGRCRCRRRRQIWSRRTPWWSSGTPGTCRAGMNPSSTHATPQPRYLKSRKQKCLKKIINK